MKYRNEVVIDQPLEKVIQLFDNPDNLHQWQPGFISMEPVSGTPGHPGAKSRLKYKMGKRDIEMIETIIARNLPHEFHATFETKGVYNAQENYFSSVSVNQTKWISDSEFRFSGMMKLYGWLMPGAFRRQSQKYLDFFKAFAEKEG